MIELFDAARLLPRRDHSLALAALACVLVAGGMGAYAVSLQSRLQQAEAERQALTQRLQQASKTPPPTAALVADLQRQAVQLEGAIAAASQGPAQQGLSASQWLDRLGLLAAADISLNRIDVDRAGAVRIEGMATSPQAVNGFVQAWSSQDRFAPMLARSIEVKQDKSTAPQLRFSMRASAPPVQLATAVRP